MICLPAAVAPALAQKTTYAAGLACDWAEGDELVSCFVGVKTGNQLMASSDAEVDR
jgi:hypothetical protein